MHIHICIYTFNTHIIIFFADWNLRSFFLEGYLFWCGRWWWTGNVKNWWHSTPNQLITVSHIHKLLVHQITRAQVVARLGQQYYIFSVQIFILICCQLTEDGIWFFCSYLQYVSYEGTAIVYISSYARICSYARSTFGIARLFDQYRTNVTRGSLRNVYNCIGAWPGRVASSCC